MVGRQLEPPAEIGPTTMERPFHSIPCQVGADRIHHQHGWQLARGRQHCHTRRCSGKKFLLGRHRGLRPLPPQHCGLFHIHPVVSLLFPSVSRTVSMVASKSPARRAGGDTTIRNVRPRTETEEPCQRRPRNHANDERQETGVGGDDRCHGGGDVPIFEHNKRPRGSLLWIGERGSSDRRCVVTLCFRRKGEKRGRTAVAP